MKTNFKSIFIILILLSILYFYFTHSVYIIERFITYSSFFLTRMVPVTFPFLLITSLLLEYGILSFLPCNLYLGVFFLSLISGFPNGVKYVHDLVENKTISSSMGNKMLLYSHFPNPLFVFGTIYLSLDGNIYYTGRLYLSIFLSHFFIFLFMKKEKKGRITFQKTKNSFHKNLQQGIFSTSKIILLIYGISIFFTLLLSILVKIGSFSTDIYVLLCGVFDLVEGVSSIRILGSIIHRVYFLLLFLEMGSISIHMQVRSILDNSSLSYSSFLLGRVLSLGISFLILKILL